VTRELALNLLSAGLYAVGAIFMKASDGLRSVIPALCLYGCFGLGATFQALALQRQDVGAGNTVVLGVEAIGSFALAIVLFRESVTPSKLLAIALVASGVYILRR
jgi:quaternary ammonium compound-resistance protein SugE